jgi:hypothetical protein
MMVVVIRFKGIDIVTPISEVGFTKNLKKLIDKNY